MPQIFHIEVQAATPDGRATTRILCDATRAPLIFADALRASETAKAIPGALFRVTPYGPTFEAQGALEHWEKYEKIAQRIGVDTLKREVLARVAGKDEIEHALVSALHDTVDRRALNAIAIPRWDQCHATVIGMAMAAKCGWGDRGRGWAYADTVCLLKHVARHHIAGDPPPAVPRCTYCNNVGAPRRCHECGKNTDVR